MPDAAEELLLHQHARHDFLFESIPVQIPSSEIGKSCKDLRRRLRMSIGLSSQCVPLNFMLFGIVRGAPVRIAGPRLDPRPKILHLLRGQQIVIVPIMEPRDFIPRGIVHHDDVIRAVGIRGTRGLEIRGTGGDDNIFEGFRDEAGTVEQHLVGGELHERTALVIEKELGLGRLLLLVPVRPANEIGVGLREFGIGAREVLRQERHPRRIGRGSRLGHRHRDGAEDFALLLHPRNEGHELPVVHVAIDQLTDLLFARLLNEQLIIGEVIDRRALVLIGGIDGNGAHHGSGGEDGVMEGVLGALTVGHQHRDMLRGGVGPGIVLGFEPAAILGVPLQSAFRPIGAIDQIILIPCEDVLHELVLIFDGETAPLHTMLLPFRNTMYRMGTLGNIAILVLCDVVK